MYSIRSEEHFDAAHFLAGYDGKCKNIHGHRWVVEAEISAGEVEEEGALQGMVVDFSTLKKDLKDIADRFDHTLIYEAGTLYPETLSALQAQDFALTQVPYRPTAENLAADIFQILSDRGYQVTEVAVNESPTNRAVYRR